MQEKSIVICSFLPRSTIVQLLLEHGANIDATDKDGKTPLFHAVPGPYSARDNALVLPIIRMLLEAGANVNARLPDGLTTPIFIGGWNPEIRQLLLQYNAQEDFFTRLHNLGWW